LTETPHSRRNRLLQRIINHDYDSLLIHNGFHHHTKPTLLETHMSLEQLQAFIHYTQTQNDSPLKESLQAAAAQQDLPAVAALAQTAGFAVDVEDIKEFNAQQTAELQDDQLNQSSGGANESVKLLSADENFAVTQNPSSND
jgi:predicted ribosomally synthesized peptide with nif11-like leader